MYIYLPKSLAAAYDFGQSQQQRVRGVRVLDGHEDC